MSTPKRNTNSAFTLIELLVVISIISILISILLPALGAARKTSRSVACLSNIRQLGTWAMTYAADSKGILPTHNDSGWSDTWQDASSNDWFEKLIGYGLYDKSDTESTPFKCPEASFHITPLANPSRGITYGINQYMGGLEKYGARRAPLPRMEIVDSKGYLYGGARAYYHSGTATWNYHPILQINNSTTPSGTWPWAWPHTELPDTPGHPTHNNSFLYGDGHGGQLSMENWQSMASSERVKFLAREWW